MRSHIAPATLDPWTRICAVEELPFLEVHTIGIILPICNIEIVCAIYAKGYRIRIFVVGTDADFSPSLIILQPATSVFWS